MRVRQYLKRAIRPPRMLSIDYALHAVFRKLVLGSRIVIEDYESKIYLGSRVAADRFFALQVAQVQVLAQACGMLAMSKSSQVVV